MSSGPSTPGMRPRDHSCAAQQTRDEAACHACRCGGSSAGAQCDRRLRALHATGAGRDCAKGRTPRRWPAFIRPSGNSPQRGRNGQRCQQRACSCARERLSSHAIDPLPDSRRRRALHDVNLRYAYPWTMRECSNAISGCMQQYCTVLRVNVEHSVTERVSTVHLRRRTALLRIPLDILKISEVVNKL